MDGLRWTLVVLVAAAVLVVVDRLVARWEPRERRRPERPPGGSGTAAFGEVVELFQPNARFLHEERERQRQDLVQPGDADPMWVDLDSGSVAVGGRRSRLEPMAPGVWTTVAHRWRTRTTVVVDHDRCLVVDPALTPQDLEALASDLHARGWRPVAGFATHAHWDHVLWSTALGDVPRWATAETVSQVATHRARLLREADDEVPGHDHAVVGRLAALPTAPADTPVEVPWGGPRAVVIPYSGHCPGSAALVLPDSGVLLAGDVLSDVEIPLLDRDAADPVGDYERTLDLLEAAAARWEVSVVVPGHGSPCDRAGLAERLRADRAYLAALSTDGGVDDPRLEDPEQVVEHTAQVRLVRR